jgi:pyrroline-5-carboxylate reductase
VLGAAKIVLETGKHPGQLKDEVCSSGGTTIEAIYALERKGFRGHVIEAIEMGTEKSKRLSEK